MTILSELLDIKYSILLAPMFLVTNEDMVGEAIQAGATGALVAHNYENEEQLRKAIQYVKHKYKGPFGVNLTLDFASGNFNKRLQVCVDEQVDFIISSLGDPQKIVEACHPKGIKVFSDVVNLRHAQKAVERGVDALIAVNRNAGGHAGMLSAEELIPQLLEKFDIPVISAGGVATHEAYNKALELGASGVSVGSAFIATRESKVSDDYKNAIVQGKGVDIVLTRRISGVPMTVIQTDYIKMLGAKRTWVEKKLKKHRKTRKALRKFLVNSGFARFQHYVAGPDYKKVYCAGPSIEHINEVSTVKAVLQRIIGLT